MTGFGAPVQVPALARAQYAMKRRGGSVIRLRRADVRYFLSQGGERFREIVFQIVDMFKPDGKP